LKLGKFDIWKFHIDTFLSLTYTHLDFPRAGSAIHEDIFPDNGFETGLSSVRETVGGVA